MFLPLADNFLVLIILAAFSCPVHSFTHLRTTEKAPLENTERTLVWCVSGQLCPEGMSLVLAHEVEMCLQHPDGRGHEFAENIFCTGSVFLVPTQNEAGCHFLTCEL